MLVLARVRAARSRLAPGARDLKRARRMIAEFPDPGRLPAMAATVEQDRRIARANAGGGHLVVEPGAPEPPVLWCLRTGLSRRQIGAKLYISLNTVKTHTGELYRELDASSREGAVARADALGLLDLVESPG